MKHFLIFYETAPDYIARRPEFRTAHLAYATEAVARGELVLGGVLADPADRAILLFKAETQDVAERFAQNDPYVANMLVQSWTVREWSTVIGPEATLKVT